MAAECEHEYFEEDGYRICAHCGDGSPELGFPRVLETQEDLQPDPVLRRVLDALAVGRRGL